ncbi:LINE-1 reverse transcriptase [Portunus trituberculatus]|uniref:LINE-1 reverse transcriptase n=1 Tax=Portunus trituberculatus TaxID=210409 RepID=A0A5B7FYB7_PORTR|nr:LINE-1 reverse transcriptase [Portunus trituberculatus]
MDYLERDKPDIKCIVEMKLRPNIQVDWFGDGNYRLWRKDVKEKSEGGIIVLTRKNLTVKNMSLGGNGEEVVGLVVTDERQDINIVTLDVPPKTSAWPNEQYDDMVRSTIKRMKIEVAIRDRDVIVGDFNCREVMWEEFEVGNGEEWGEQMLDFAMENLLTQWVRHPIKGRQGDTLSRLDLIFTKGVQIRQGIEYECPLGKSDHELLKFCLDVGLRVENGDGYKEELLNYARARYNDLRRYCGNVDWSTMYQEVSIQSKYDKFMKIYNKALENSVLKYTKKTLRRNQWFNKNCKKAKSEKEKALRNYKRNNEEAETEAYRTARNRYAEVRQKAQKEYEQKIVENCERDQKVFHKFINSKLQKKEIVKKVKVGDDVYEDVSDIVAKLNDCFCKIFTSETEFNGIILPEKKQIQDVIVSKSDIEKVVNGMDINKSIGPDGVSGRMLKECQEQLLEPILDIMKTPITIGQVPGEWKRADVVPIEKSGCRMEPLNYRPVSLTTIICKICEEIIKAKWCEFLESEGILRENQFGFRIGKSCVSNLLCFY